MFRMSESAHRKIRDGDSLCKEVILEYRRAIEESQLIANSLTRLCWSDKDYKYREMVAATTHEIGRFTGNMKLLLSKLNKEFNAVLGKRLWKNYYDLQHWNWTAHLLQDHYLLSH